MFRKVVSSGAMQLSRAGKNSAVKSGAFTQRSFSSVLETREIGEETKYIRTMEAQRKAEIRAKIEEGHEERAGLEQLLGKPIYFLD